MNKKEWLKKLVLLHDNAVQTRKDVWCAEIAFQKAQSEFDIFSDDTPNSIKDGEYEIDDKTFVVKRNDLYIDIFKK